MHRRHAGLALLLAASTAHALPRDVVLTTRAAVCPKDAVTCGSSLPSDFCCPKNTSCEALAGDTSALCCPAGGDCSRIQPISCNVRLQDPQSHADGPVFTSIFDIDLPKCGTNCCPFGYTCVDSGCTRDTDQSKEPSSKPPSSSSSSAASSSTPASSTTTSASATTTTASTSAHTTTPAAAATTTAAPSSDAHDDHGGGMDSTTISIIGGTVGGVFLITAVLVTIFLCIRRRKKRTPAGASSSSSSSSSRRGLAPSRSHEKPGTSSDSVSIRARGFHISEPIRQDEPPYRTDFAALKSPSAASSISQQPVNARWSGSGGGGSRRGGGGGGAASGRHLTPPARPPREPAAPPPRQQQQQQQQPAAAVAAAPAMSLRPPSFPNPFSSPSPDAGGGARDSVGSSFYEHYNTNDEPSRTGHVVSRQPVPPIRGMNASGSRRSEAGEFRRQPSSESIDVFADDDDIAPLRTQPPQQRPQQEQQYLHPDEYLRPQQQQQQQEQQYLHPDEYLRPQKQQQQEQQYLHPDEYLRPQKQQQQEQQYLHPDEYLRPQQQQQQQYLHPDEYLRPQQQQQQGHGHGHDARDRDTTYTTMSNLMDEAGLGEMYRGKKRYVPDTTPGR